MTILERSLVDSDADTLKACCSTLYADPAVSRVLGDSFHPGGLDLTTRLGNRLDLTSDDIVIDLACGRGTSALHLAQKFGCRVIGIDLSRTNIEAARALATELELDRLCSFEVGDAEDIPLPDSSATVVICECALCTFPDQSKAVEEVKRVLRSGGRVGLTDVTLHGPLPASMQTVLMHVACIASARSPEEYSSLFHHRGFKTMTSEDVSGTLAELVAGIGLALGGWQIASALGRIERPSFDIDKVLAGCREVRGHVDRGLLGYHLFCFERE